MAARGRNSGHNYINHKEEQRRNSHEKLLLEGFCFVPYKGGHPLYYWNRVLVQEFCMPEEVV
jgi:hypothetical protein